MNPVPTILEDDPIISLLLSGAAQTVAEAESAYLHDHIPDVLRLVASDLPDEAFRRHPLIALLLSHGSRSAEDSLR